MNQAYLLSFFQVHQLIYNHGLIFLYLFFHLLFKLLEIMFLKSFFKFLIISIKNSKTIYKIIRN